MHLVLTYKLKLIFIRIYCVISVVQHSDGDVSGVDGGGDGDGKGKGGGGQEMMMCVRTYIRIKRTSHCRCIRSLSTIQIINAHIMSPIFNSPTFGPQHIHRKYPLYCFISLYRNRIGY